MSTKATIKALERVFAAEIAPVAVPQRKGEPIMVTEDEGIRADTTTEGLGKTQRDRRNWSGWVRSNQRHVQALATRFGPPR